MMLYVYIWRYSGQSPAPVSASGDFISVAHVMSDMSRADRQRLRLFFALFFGTVGFLISVFSCGTEYWLLASQSCGRTEPASGTKTLFQPDVEAQSDEFSVLDLWNTNQELCNFSFLFPFPVNEPLGCRPESRRSAPEPFEPRSAIVFRTFWSIFLVTALTSIPTGSLVAICACPLSKPTLFKVGGAFQLCGGLSLLMVLLLYVVWVDFLDTLEDVVQYRRRSSCPEFQLSVMHGPSFLLAPAAVFFLLTSGLLLIVSQNVLRTERIQKTSSSSSV
ncbi:Transmembrane protein 182 [Takifugu flavidus]|uniref:Transmembrane protein 182 n=1 Tax=Takifugu flavidus TaxID=433684 RepID=A0A5C6N9E2_9TELE|nr:Transmembrane protein 182 [Takifugu flavidus]